jgi:L-fuconolactonase
VRIDSHLHLWDPGTGRYTWLRPHHGPLNAPFTPESAERELLNADVAQAVLVQAADAAADTQSMLDTATDQPWVAAVVGWVDLEDPDAAAASLDRWCEHPAFRGVRQLIHEDPRPYVLTLPAVQRTLRQVSARGLTLDVPDAFPRYLDATSHLADALDDLVVVVDHLGKPPRGTDAMGEWERQIRAAARRANIVAKVSGLGCETAPLTSEALREVWDVVLDAFGPSRLMFGSDWPVSLLHGGYGTAADVTAALVGELSVAEQEDIWWRTAARVYRIDDQAKS